MTRAELEQSLRHEDAERRRQAIIELEREQGDAGTASLIIEGLGDSDWRVRKEAVRVAAELAGRMELVPKLVDALSDGENVGRRNAALEVFGRLGPACVDDLLDALPQVPAGVRKFIIDALGDGGSPRTVPVLVDSLEDEDPNVSAAALDALGRIGGPQAEAALRTRLQASDPFQRLAALDGLARLEAVVPWEELEPLLEDRLVRRVALTVLGRTGRPEAVAPLAGALSDRLGHVVSDAAIALVRLRNHSEQTAEAVARHLASLPGEARQGLRRLLREGSDQARKAAAQLLLLAQDEGALSGIVELASEDALPPEALGALRLWGEGAVRPLLEVYRDRVNLGRGAALEMASDLAAEPLSRGGAPDPETERLVRAALAEAASDSDESVVLAAARSMTWWGRPEDAPRLAELASRGSEEVARACGEALESLARVDTQAVQAALEGVDLTGPAGAALTGVLARVGGDRVFERLQTALSADSPTTRRAAVEALKQMGGARAAEVIGYALTDENVDVQTAAARALGRMRGEDGRPLGNDALLLSLQSDTPAVQAAAARALGEAGVAAAVEPLRELVRSTDPGVAVAAMEALRSLQDPTLGDLLVEALGHRDPEVVKQALQAIRESGTPRTASRLALGLEHLSWDVRALAARLLGELGGQAARERLQTAFEKESDDLVRAAIEEALQGAEGGA
jgi:HEAT repeat protein